MFGTDGTWSGVKNVGGGGKLVDGSRGSKVGCGG